MVVTLKVNDGLYRLDEDEILALGTFYGDSHKMGPAHPSTFDRCKRCFPVKRMGRMTLSDIATGTFLAYYAKVEEPDYWKLVSPPLKEVPTPDLVIGDLTVEVKFVLRRHRLKSKLDEAIDQLILTGRKGNLRAFVLLIPDFEAFSRSITREGVNDPLNFELNFVTWTPRVSGWREGKYFLYQEGPVPSSLMVTKRGGALHLRLRSSFPGGGGREALANLVSELDLPCKFREHDWDLMTCRFGNGCGFAFPGSLELNLNGGAIRRSDLLRLVKGKGIEEILKSFRRLYK